MRIIITENQQEKLLQTIVEQGFFDRLKHKIKGIFTDDFIEGPCSTEMTKKANNWKQLYQILVQNKRIKNGEPMLIVWGKTQTMYYTSNGVNLIKQYKVSTGNGGYGDSAGNKLTSPGLMKVVSKIRAPKRYQVLVGKRPVNIVLGPNKDSIRKDEDGVLHPAEVTTGILSLKGLEQCNKNAYSRGIYIHGTNREAQLGKKASGGCVRVSNESILELINTVKEGTKVFVQP